LNSYSYSDDNPVTKEDPSGLTTNSNSTQKQIAQIQLQVLQIQIQLQYQIKQAAIAASQQFVGGLLDPISGAKTAADKSVPAYQGQFGGFGAAFGMMASFIAPETRVMSGERLLSQISIHANDLDYDGVNYGYKLVDTITGEIKKFGETVSPRTRYTDKFLNENNMQLQLVTYGPKQAVHDWQHDMITEYFNQNGGIFPESLPSLNKSFW
jgi:hypothetical protein